MDVVRKEFKNHLGEMESLRNVAREKHGSSARWVTFEDNNENCHPNLFVHHEQSSFPPVSKEHCYYTSNSGGGSTKCFGDNSFFHDYSESDGNKLRSESVFFQDQNRL